MPIDYNLYCDDWHLRSRFIRFYRANNKCEECGAENYKPHPVTGSKVVLTTAHLDQNINNNSFFNLKALCQHCHFAHDRKDNIRRRKENKLKNQYKLNLETL